jgi:hypothetical protein
VDKLIIDATKGLYIDNAKLAETFDERDEA